MDSDTNLFTLFVVLRFSVSTTYALTGAKLLFWLPVNVVDWPWPGPYIEGAWLVVGAEVSAAGIPPAEAPPSSNCVLLIWAMFAAVDATKATALIAETIPKVGSGTAKIAPNPKIPFNIALALLNFFCVSNCLRAKFF